MLTVLAWGDPIQIGSASADGINVIVKSRVEKSDGTLVHVDTPAFVTEMVAFFKTIGTAKALDKKGNPTGKSFYAFERSSFGIVNLRFNKNRMLVFTHTGKRDVKEAYAFTVSKNGVAKFVDVKQV